MKFFYSAYNFILESEFKCSGLTEIPATKSDIKVKVSDIPANFQKGVKKLINNLVKYRINSKGEIELDIIQVARFFISGGNKIIIEPYKNTENQNIQIYLFGTVLSLLFHQRGMFTLHGSAVAKNGRCIVFTGKSKAGKSTFANIFQQNGYKLLTDDVCLLNAKPNGDFLVHSAIPRVSLRADVIKKFAICESKLYDLRLNEKKYGYNLAHNFEINPVPIEVIYEIIPEGEEFKIKALKGVEKISVLIKNTYRFKAIDELDLHAKHFDVFSKIANKIPVKQINRPIGKFAGEDIVKMVEDDLTIVV